MIIINEVMRHNVKNNGYSKNGVKTINSSDKLRNKCTWICHNLTQYCKSNHVKVAKSYFNLTDKFYFKVINSLKDQTQKENYYYRCLNILFFVVLVPLCIWYFTIKSINIQDKIVELKNLKK